LVNGDVGVVEITNVIELGVGTVATVQAVFPVVFRAVLFPVPLKMEIESPMLSPWAAAKLAVIVVPAAVTELVVCGLPPVCREPLKFTQALAIDGAAPVSAPIEADVSVALVSVAVVAVRVVNAPGCGVVVPIGPGSRNSLPSSSFAIVPADTSLNRTTSDVVSAAV
jgi:hypothetical protein